MKYINKKKLLFVIMLFLIGIFLLWESITFLFRHMPGKADSLHLLSRAELAAARPYVPMLAMLAEEKDGGKIRQERRDVQAVFFPWLAQVYEEGWEKQAKTQENEAYRHLILEDDSTDYYAFMQQENENTAEPDGEAQSLPQEKEPPGGTAQDEQAGEEAAQDGAESGENAYDMKRREAPVYEYDPSQLNEYEALVKSFYVIDENTYAGPEVLSAEQFMQKDYRVDKGTEGPAVLIYHTHSLEAFADSAKKEPADTVVGAGERLAAYLRELGYNVMHDTTAFDLEGRDYAYSEALPYIENLLEEYPSIRVVIDLHRDEMREDTHLVTNIDGKDCARYMFFNGMSRLRGSGKIEYLENPFLEDNLGFSFQLQKASNEYYPGLSRKIYLKAYRYNLHLRPASVLIELGAQNNTVEEIMNACGPLAQVIDIVLSGEGAEGDGA